jgi:SAM-dependent methyltransferase
VVALINTTGCHGWGIEPSDGMRRHAAFHQRLEVLEGSAERLPFDDDFFSLVFSVNLIHHIVDRLAYFLEAKRVVVPGGMVCTVTDSTEMIRNRKPLSQYWPSTATVDIKRYPTVGSLLDNMSQVGFFDLATREIRIPFSVSDSSLYRDRAFSCLHLISEAEFRQGLARLESDLREGPVNGLGEYVCIWGKVP